MDISKVRMNAPNLHNEMVVGLIQNQFGMRDFSKL